MEKVIQVIELIKEKHPEKKPKESITGTIECPECKGVLYYTISSFNGHIWGKCEKEGCLGWMM